MKRIVLVAVTLAALVTTSQAHAECDGGPMIGGAAKERLNLARESVQQGRNGYAFRLAHSIPSLEDASAAEIGEARAISAFVYWKNGDVKRADHELALAKTASEPSASAFLHGLKDAAVRDALTREMSNVAAEATVARKVALRSKD